MKKIFLAFACCLPLVMSAQAADNDADNTGKNKRDQSNETMTSGDQSETKEDIEITAAIRRAVVKDENLTMTAKNVKIITANGEVTLRGPVKSADEKKKIGSYAKSSGAKKVKNELEIKKENN